MQQGSSRRGRAVTALAALALLLAACGGPLPVLVPLAAVTPATPALATLPPAATPAPAVAQPAVTEASSQAPTTSPAIAPTPLPQHVVAAGDTLWAIAERFSIAPELLLAANPGLMPDQLAIGQVLAIPSPGMPLAALPATAGPVGWVAADSGGLRLRSGPSLGAAVLMLLAPLTPLELAARTVDGQWLQVQVPSAEARGWVSAEWVTAYAALDGLPVTDQVVDLARPEPTAAPATELPAPVPTADAGSVAASATGFDYASTISGVSPRAREIFQLGQALGNKPNVFSKVGDSITVSPVFMAPISGGGYDLHDHGALQGVIDYFYWGIARDNNDSFANVSLAARVSWRARAVMSPGAGDPAICREGEAPLNCEFRLVRPAVALIMLGTNDVPYTPVDEYEADMRRVLDTTLEWGVIPVLSTIPPLYRTGLEGRAELLNTVIVKLAREYDIPLWDYYAALAPLPGAGMTSDGVHPSWAPVGHSADFGLEYLRFGMTVRNLTGLYALDAVWRGAMQP